MCRGVCHIWNKLTFSYMTMIAYTPLFQGSAYETSMRGNIGWFPDFHLFRWDFWWSSLSWLHHWVSILIVHRDDCPSRQPRRRECQDHPQAAVRLTRPQWCLTAHVQSGAESLFISIFAVSFLDLCLMKIQWDLNFAHFGQIKSASYNPVGHFFIFNMNF